MILLFLLALAQGYLNFYHLNIFSIQQVPQYDKDGSFNENGKYKCGDAWKNHDNTHHFAVQTS